MTQETMPRLVGQHKVIVLPYLKGSGSTLTVTLLQRIHHHERIALGYQPFDVITAVYHAA